MQLINIIITVIIIIIIIIIIKYIPLFKFNKGQNVGTQIWAVSWTLD
jgi:hypothetical protein